MTPHQYRLDVLTDDGRPLAHTVVAPDWSAAFAWSHFEGIRDGSLPARTRARQGTVEPVWDPRRGEPHVARFRVTVRSDAGAAATREIPRTYLRSLVHDVARDLVRRGVLPADGTYRWTLTALPAPAAVPSSGHAASDGTSDETFDVEEIAVPLPFDEAPLAAFEAASVDVDVDDETRHHVPVFVPRAVVDEAIARAVAVGDVETGGVLVGKLHRDVVASDGRAPALFVEVTAQVPAAHTRASSTSLTFTGDTWAAVRSAIALRRRGEIVTGWWHAHPDWCRLRGCPPERRRTCSATDPFLSSEDVHLTAVCFPSGHQVALLLSDSTAAGGFTASMFGWWEGCIVPRGFHVLERHRAERVDGGEHAAHGAS